MSYQRPRFVASVWLALHASVLVACGQIDPQPVAEPPDAGSNAAPSLDAGSPRDGEPAGDARLADAAIDATALDATPADGGAGDAASYDGAPDASDQDAGPLDRPLDPVVLTGAQLLPGFVGLPPGAIVAFARGDAGWSAVPVQVDERRSADVGTLYGQAATGLSILAYADPQTPVGADTDPTLDDDDQIVFMVKDTGPKAPPGAADPAGVIAHSGMEIEVHAAASLLQNTSYLYLFKQAGSLDASAGKKYVTYAHTDSSATVTTAAYSQHFVGRWVTDELRIHAGSANGADILDRTKILFGPGICGETDDTFNSNEGFFLTRKDGPVRAIRSYLGAASGPYTQRDHFFYAQRADTTTYLRVHQIPGIMDLVDYSAAAIGMTHFASSNLGGDLVDGLPAQSTSTAETAWDLITGAQGSVVNTYALNTSIPAFAPSYYYEDNATDGQCTGDGHSYGLSGPWIQQTIPCTDPVACAGNASFLTAVRIAYFGLPGWTVASASTLSRGAKGGIGATVAPWSP